MTRAGESLYSPVRKGADGSVTVELGETHPGFADAGVPRPARRDRVARDRSRVRRADSAGANTATSNTTCGASSAASSRRSIAATPPVPTSPASKRSRFPAITFRNSIDVTARLAPISGFTYEPIAGLAPLRTFYESFDDNVFFSTQYIRHHSSPLYTPEPDIVHEVIGHANQLADPTVARLYGLVGSAVRRVETDDALRLLSRVFWFTFEFGVVEEDGELKTYGAGILSSFGELDAFRDASMRAARLRRNGTGRLRHHQVPADPVPSAIHDGSERRARGVPHRRSPTTRRRSSDSRRRAPRARTAVPVPRAGLPSGALRANIPPERERSPRLWRR